MSVKKFWVMITLSVLTVGTVKAQDTVRAFTERASFDEKGNISIIGNTLFTCQSGGNCSSVQNGTQNGDNGRDMVFVDVDPSAPGSYANSSRADLNLPANSTVLYAALYWGGRDRGNESDRNTIYLRTPASASYNTITASVIDTFTNEGTNSTRPYQAMADVTTLVSNGGNGQYFVGGMAAETGNDGLGFYGGWSIAVIYQNNADPYRRLNLFDGAVRVAGSSSVSVNVTGLVTPSTSGFETHVGALVWEGDRSITGDSITFESTVLNRTLNPSNNFWNSSITNQNVRVTSKNPDYVNQLSMDLDLMDVTGLLAPGSTTAQIDFTTNGDSYFPHYLIFATELFAPDYSQTLSKTANDLNGGEVVRGDVIEYTISFENTGTDTATNTILTDIIPANMTYVPGSMEIISSDAGDPIGGLSDSTGNDRGEFDGTQLTFYLGAGANGATSSGGTFTNGEGASVRFQATVDMTAPVGTITNTAEIVANSPTLPTVDFTSSDSADISINDIIPPAAASCVVTPNPASDGSALTATCTGVEAGGSVSIPNYTCGAESGGTVICTATAGPGGVTGDETATTSDAAGNTATSVVPFSLDNTAPVAASCTVDPNPASDGTALTATCTGVETGGSVSIPNYTCGSEAGGTVICTATAGPGGVTGDETATTSDAAGNTATSVAAFTLDNTAPTIGTCSVSPDPANNGTVVTATCNGVEAGATLTIPGYVCTDNGGGNWSCTGTVGTGGVDGDEVATATDDAGNTATTPAVFTLDNTAPAAAVCTVNPNPANDGTALTATCTGVEAGGSVSIPNYTCGSEAGGTVICTATAGPGGVTGDETATTSDAAGNTATSVAAFTLDNTAPTIGTCSVSPDPANNGTVVTATCNGVEAGATLTIPGYVCTDNGGGNWSCTGTVGTGGVDGDEVATATDDAGNASTTPAGFTLDNTAPAAAVCTVNPNPASDGTALTATCTGVEAGGSVSIPNYTCGSEAGGTVICTATAGPGGVTGDETATTSDAAGNTATSVAAFTLDNTAPTIGTCSVSPDPANNGTVVTATCNGVEAGATLTIPGYVCTDNGGGNWSCTGTVGTGGVDGDEVATATDDAGNTSTTPAGFTLDNTAPAAAVCTVNPNPANDGTALTATCTGVEVGGSVSIPNYTCGSEAGGTVICTATAGPGGVTGDETATTSDAAGNTATSVAAFTLDNTAPTIGTCSVSPDPANNGTVVTATCNGVEAGATLTIPGYVCTDNGGGNWSCTGTVGTGGVDGDEVATATDDAGNTATTPANFTLDNDAPPAPGIDTPTNGNPVTGTGEPGATVTVTTPSGSTCTAVVQLDGTWSCTLSPSPVDGEDITATQEDAAGNTSPPTTVVGGIDTTAPSAPVINPVNENTDPITGTAEPGSTIDLTGVTCDNEPIITNASGLWSCVTSSSLPLTPGDLIVATATDAAGNVSQPASTTVADSATQSIAPTVNPVANGATEITGTAIAGSAINIDGITCTNDPVTANASGNWICISPAPVPVTDDIIMVTATQSGLLESPAVSTTVYNPGTTAPPAPQVNPTDGDPVTGNTISNGDITVLDDLGNVLCTTTADAAGNFTCSPVIPLPAHNDVLSVIVTDGNGNSSLPTQVVVDSLAPAVPVCTVTPDPANTGTALTATCTGVETDATVTIPGYVCGVEFANEVSCTATAGTAGVDGDEVATITDAVGNFSNADVFFTLDDTPPNTGSITSVSDDTGVSSSDYITSDNTLFINGTAEAGTTVEVFIDGFSIGTTLTDGSGNWSFDYTTIALADGDYDVHVVVTDAAGNVSPASASQTITIDASSPGAAIITAISDDNGISNSDFDTNDNTLFIHGTAEAGAIIEVFVDGFSVGTVIADGSGNWTFDYTGTTLSDGSYEITAGVSDVAGNLGPDSDPQTVIIDTSVPGTPVCSVTPDPANTGTALTATCTGVETGATVTIPGYVCGTESGNTVNCTATAGQNGVDGDEVATITDTAGNFSNADVFFTLDNTPPPVAVCTVTPDPASTGTALTATCTGVETDAVVTIPGYVCGTESGNTVTCTATAGQNGVDGNEVATITDEAGNFSNADVLFTLDDTPPPVAVCTVTPDPASTGTALTATCTGVETDAVVTIPGYVCGAESGNTVTCTATAGQNGVDGDELATITDAAGNFSNADVLFTLDDTPPPIAVCTVTPDPASTGTALTATCTGVETGAVVTIPGYVCGVEAGNAVTCTATAGQNGVDGDEVATITDAAGNFSQADAFFTLDDTAPTDPVITSPADGITINDSTPEVVGTGEAGSTITVTGPLGETCTTTVDLNGDWSCVLSPALQNGSNTITAIATDDAGNQSGTDSVNVIIDATAGYNLVVNAPAELVTTEMGGSDTFTVALGLTPTANVTVNFSSSNTDEGTVAPASVTFTPSNWNDPVTITVTGVDDLDYDLDQDYQIIISPMVSADLNYQGVDPADLDAINIDDDESPDLTAFITNCIAGVLPTDTLTYQLSISNTGNKDIIAADVATVLGTSVSTPSWVCQSIGGASCGALSGTGDLSETVDLPAGSSLLYLLDVDVTGQVFDFIDVEGSVTMPTGEIDVNPADNIAFDSDLVYLFIFKNGFECAAPGTVQTTNDLLNQIIN